MDSPKKRRRRLGLSLGKKRGAEVSPLNESSRNGIKQDDNGKTISGTRQSKSLSKLRTRITTEEGPSEATSNSHSLNESSASVDLFENCSPHSETQEIACLPLQNASFPVTPLGSHRQIQNNDSSILQPLDPNMETEGENLPPTQPAAAYILSSVVAYVEVRAGGDNRSRLIMRELRNLGATVVETLRKTVTHIVFRDGKLSTYKLAVDRSVHMVSVQWIYECRKEKKIVPEYLYPPHDLEFYKDPSKHKMIKRVKSFQPDYDMDQEQRLKRIRIRTKPRAAPVVTNEYVSIREEYEMENEFMRRRIHRKMEMYKSPGECGLVRGLLTIAGPIDPAYNDYIQRPVSPTSSEDETVPVPLAVKLMRMFQSPQPSSSKKLQSNQPITPGIRDENFKNENIDDDDIEANLAALFGESSDTDSSDIFPQKNTQEEPVQTVTPETFTADLSDNVDQPPAKLRKTQSTKFPALEVTAVTIDNLPATPGPTTSQRAVRKLFNAPREDDSPKLILPSCSETESSQSMSKDTRPARRKNLKKTPKKSLCADMEITTCVGNGILDDPSSMRTKSARKSDRIKARRSSVFFAPPKPTKKTDSECGTSSGAAALPTIVCTSLTLEEVTVIKRIVKELGGFEVEDTVTRKTTHVVSMNKCNRRTVNILRGIARGCWIVKKMWVLQSLEAGRWIAEDEFEWTDFSPAVQLCRHERKAFSPFYRPGFFKECGPIFVSKTSKPSRKDLCELICLCGGKVTFNSSAANIVVGESGKAKSTAYVNVQWVLDTIQAAELKPIEEYTFLVT